MKTFLFFYNYKTTECDLSSIKTREFRFILITTKTGIKNWSKDKLSVFDEVTTITTMTFEDAVESIRHYERQFGADLNMVSNEEGCIPIVAKLHDHFGMPGFSLKDIVPFTDKLIMKEVLKKYPIRLPKHVELNNTQYLQNNERYIEQLEKAIPYPMFAKPTTLFGSAATRKILSRLELKSWVESVSKTGLQYELDEFIEGTLYHCDAIIQNDKVAYTAVFEYTYPCALFSEGYPLGSIYLPEGHPDRQVLNNFNLSVLKVLKPKNGVTHLEAFKTKKGEIIFLEIAARAVGAYVVPIHEKATGINLELEHFKAQMGIVSPIKEDKNRDYYSWIYIPKMPGKVKKLKNPELKSQYDLNWLIQEGDVIPELTSTKAVPIFLDAAIAGKLIWHHSDFSIVYRDFEIVQKNRLIEYE